MRITQTMLVRNTLQRVNQNKTTLNDLNRSLATGRRVIESSDDPVSFSKVARFKTSIKQSEQFIRNINDANGWVNVTASAMDQLVSLISDAKEAALRGADALTSAEMRASLAQTIDGKIEEVITIANSKHAGKNLFGGTETKRTDLFSINGDIVNYFGNDEDISRRISENLNITINTTGQQLIDTGLFQSFVDLRNALNNDDVPAIQSSIDALAVVEENVLTLSTTSGSVMNNLSLAENRLESALLELRTLVSRNEDADIAETIVKYDSEELAYRAAMESASRMLNLNILDYFS